MQTAIRVEGLGKQYRIGVSRGVGGYKTLREALAWRARLLGSKLRPRGPGAAGHASTELFWALKDVSFEVRAGEVVGIIGRNGAGKTTLLKILSRITEPTEGRAEIRGRVGSLLEVGTGFHAELTGRENIYLNGAVLGMTRAEIQRKFDEIVAFAEIERFLETPVKRYSSGMYVRLAFAVAAHLEPEILLVDEVLAVGDIAFQKKCLGKMGDITREGRTVLFVSHQMNAVEQLCRTCMQLESGHVKRFSNDVRAVIHEYVASGEKVGDAIWVNTARQYANPWFHPLRFFIADQQGKPRRMPVANDEEIWVQIEGEIGEVDRALTVGYAVYSEEGYTLYWSYPTDGPEGSWLKLDKGRHVLRGRIPSRFLNEGTYRVELIGGLHFRQWLFEPGHNAPSIHLQVQGGLSDSPYWLHKRAGLLAPLLPWEKVE